MTNSAVHTLLFVGIGLPVCIGLGLSLLQLIKRSSMRRAVRIADRGALPRWSTLHLEEVARIRARPKRLPRGYQGFRPWQGTQPPGKRTEGRRESS